MRRSLAPSQRNKPVLDQNDATAKPASSTKLSESNNKDEMTIERMPMFGFLEIPEGLNKQFKVPSGCEITEENLALRKVKRLGPPNKFHIVRPGELNGFRITPKLFQPMQDGLVDEEELPTSTEKFPPFEPLVLWTASDGSDHKIEVVPELACKLRPHQREGVQFLFECTMGLRGFEGEGCILADDMGLGKTLMSITVLWTLLNQGFTPNQSAIRKVMVVCPTSLVGNWDNELRKWLGDRCPTFAVKSEPKKMIRNFLLHRGKGVLIISYETQRLYHALFDTAKKNMTSITASAANASFCDMLICDEAHKLKNAESELAKSLSNLPGRKRVLLSGTPMQNELTEFYNMVNFCNPNVLGNLSEFRRRYERPILASREPGATDSEIREAGRLQKELSVIVNEFILKRGNILNAQHLPPKLVQVVCCRLTPLQEALYERLLSSKEIRHIQQGKQTNTLGVIRQLINICSHPQLILDQYNNKLKNKEVIDDDLTAIAQLIPTMTSSSLGGASNSSFGGQQQKPKSMLLGNKGSNSGTLIDPNQSGKMTVLHRMMQTMRAINKSERVVIVSNYTSTLDLIEAMCTQNNWNSLRLDGTVNGAKRTKLVEEFNNPMSNSFAFLLSSKAGGCGINLIGGNRLVLFDPDWNPASDKQAAGRIWREGQKRRCFIYRFMSTGTIEEKIIQRQLSKEGLADIVDDKEQINHFSSEELRQLFTLLKHTRSDTHDTLACSRCSFMQNRLLQHSEEANGETNSSKSKKGSNKKGTKFTSEQITACIKFLDDFETWLQSESKAFQRRENTRCQVERPIFEELPFHHHIEQMKSQLSAEIVPFDSLTSYSRKQRELFQDIDNWMNKEGMNEIHYYKPEVTGDEPPLPSEGQAVQEAPPAPQAATHDKGYYFYPGFSMYSQFLRQWTDIVPLLMQSSTQQVASSSSTVTSKAAAGEEGNNVAASGTEGNQNVDQEGCPEESDLNKWSHHCSPLTCDDELFSKALGDDESLVSFVFGLEINWSLLELREEEAKEENERRKLQQIKDLEELNARRLAKKEKKAAKADKGGEGGGESEDEDDEIVVCRPKAKKEKRAPPVDVHGDGDGANAPAAKKKKKQPSSLPLSTSATVVASDVAPPPAAAASSRTARQESSSSSSSSNNINNTMTVSSCGPDQCDIAFNHDRKKLNNHLAKGKLDLNDFDKFWLALKVLNNNWRAFIADDGTEIFAREPGLKAKNMHKYEEGVEYFKMPTGLMRFVIKQYRLAGDERMAGAFEPMLLQLQQKEEESAAASDDDNNVANNDNDAMNVEEAVEELILVRKRTKSSTETMNDIFGDSDKEDGKQQQGLQVINLCHDSPVVIKKRAVATVEPVVVDICGKGNEKKRSAIDLEEDDDEAVFDPLQKKSPVVEEKAEAASQQSRGKKPRKLSAFNVESDSDDMEERELPASASASKEMASKRLNLNPSTQSLSSPLPFAQFGGKKKVQFDEVSLGKENSQNQGSSQQQPSQDNEKFWTCSFCTFGENPNFHKRCQLCNKARNGSKRIAAKELSQLIE